MEYFTRKPDNLIMPKSVSDIVVYKTKEQKLQEIDNLFKQINRPVVVVTVSPAK